MKPRIAGRIIWLPRSDPIQEAELDAKHARVSPGALQWHIEEAQVPGLLKQAASFVTAVTSSLLDEETYARRRAVCEACPLIQRTQADAFCGGCGCGQRASAELGTKLRMSKATCPRNKW